VRQGLETFGVGVLFSLTFGKLLQVISKTAPKLSEGPTIDLEGKMHESYQEPIRENFQDQETYEEFWGFWWSRIGRYQRAPEKPMVPSPDSQENPYQSVPEVANHYHLLHTFGSGATDSWVWDLWLTRVDEATYSAELVMSLFDRNSEDELPSFLLPVFSDGAELYHFLDSSWRNENEEGLDQEDLDHISKALRDIDVSLYNGFQNGLSGDSEEIDNNDEIEVESAILACIANAQWDRHQFGGGGAMWASIGQESRGRAAVTYFVNKYHSENWQLPIGLHRVRVVFGSVKDGADCEPSPWSGGVGVFEEDVTFHSGG